MVPRDQAAGGIGLRGLARCLEASMGKLLRHPSHVAADTPSHVTLPQAGGWVQAGAADWEQTGSLAVSIY